MCPNYAIMENFGAESAHVIPFNLALNAGKKMFGFCNHLSIETINPIEVKQN
jgi:hypothetical protein